MKKFTFLTLATLMAMFMWLPGNAQVPIGEQDGTSSNIPIYSCYEFSYSQQLFYQSEINAAGDITSISFFYDSGATDSSTDWTIYLGHTAKTEFTSDTDWIDMADLTEVYTGTVSFPAEGNQMVITFDTPFTYNDTDNLVVAVDENQPGYNCSIDFGKTTDSSVDRGIYYRNDSNNPDPASPPTATGTVSYINNVVLGGIQQSCPAPTDLTVDGTTENSVDISWTAGGSETDWTVKYGELGFDPESEGMSETVSGSPNTTLTGLSAALNYDFYVMADCGGGEESTLSFSGTFSTDCPASFSTPYNEDFEGVTPPALPNCTTIETITGNDWETYLQTDNGFNSNVLRYKYDFSDAADSWFFTPSIELEAGTDYQLIYTYGNNSTSYIEKLKVSYGSSAAAADMNTELDNQPDISSGTATTTTVNFTVSADDTYNFGFNAYSVSGQYYLYVDDILIREAPSCLEPLDLLVDLAGINTADLSWTAGDSETDWVVQYGEVGFDPENEGDSQSVSGSPETTLTGLDPNTTYEFYVKAQCGGTDGSDDSFFTGPKSFTTACEALTAPWSEDFENGGDIPDCWNQGENNGKDWEFADDPGINHLGDNGTMNGSTPSGGYFAWVDDSTPDFDNTTLLTPFIDVSALTTPELTFYLISDNEGYPDATISVDVYDGAAWNEDLFTSSSNTANGGWEEITVNMSNLTITGNIQIRFIVDDVNDEFYDDIAIDDVDVHEQPSCPKPFDLMVDATDATTADLSWTAGDSETDWVVYYGEAGFDPENNEGDTESVSGSPNISLTGLNSSTTYEFYVQAECGSGDSMLAGPVSFSTTCVTETAPWNEDFENGGNIPICWSQGDSNDKDWEFTDDPSGEHIGDDGTIIGSTPSGGYFAWVDDSSSEYDNTTLISPLIDVSGLTIPELTFYLLSNNEGYSNATLSVDVYDGSAWNEDVFTNNANTANGGWEEITIDLSTLTITGNIQIRFIVDDVNNEFYDDIAIDDVDVHEQPTCQKPTDLVLEDLGTTTADISWTAGGTEDQWEVRYGESGFDPENNEGSAETVNNSPEISLTGLTPNTSYSVYVKAQCGSGDGDSMFSAPINFSTNCESTTIPFTQDFENVTPPELPNCGTLENLGSGNDWETYNQTSNGFNSNVLRYKYNTSNPADVWYFTQGIDMVAGTNYELTYTYGNNSASYSEKLGISYGTSPMAADMNTELVEHPDVTGGNATTNTITFTVPADGTYYFGFHVFSGTNEYYLYVDDIEIDLGPTCPEVSNIDFENLTDTSVKVTWTPGGNDTEWDVVYGEAGFDPEAGSEGQTENVDTGTPEITLTGLSSETEYDVYVRAICGANDESDLAGPESFTTSITPPVNNYVCDAIALTANDGCANGPYTNLGAFEEADEPTGSCLTNFHGTNSVWFSFVAPSNGEATVTADFTETEFATEIVVFEAPTDCEDMNTLGDEVGCATSGSDAELTGLTPDDTYYVRLAGFDNEEGEFCIEVQGEVPDPCLAPTDITVEVQETSVDVSWTPGGNETEWEVLYGEAGFEPANDEGTSEMVMTNPETSLTDLEPNTDYEVYVRALCDDDNTSDWTGPESFNSGDMSVKDQIFANFTFYPNPVDGQLTLKAGTPIESVSVYNLLGQTVMTETPNQLQTQLNTEGLQAGVYLMKVNLNGSTKTFRVVKN